MYKLERGGRVLVAATTAAVMLLSMVVTFQSDAAVASTYTIQWGEGPDLKTPFKGLKALKAGDKLVFSYTNTDSYNVMEVDRDRYINCNGVGPTVYHTGNDTFELAKGVHYFICGAYDYCLNNNMKVNVTVI
ncbi:hypothetical protein CASFOL_013187 [Castilleja foliolosa]|uniref:Phytocyanin domain-containing protein n=1 Tax=Castilleja foliolosa TaxID=1961234 RepID=A0ABD3DK17_9LAMI